MSERDAALRRARDRLLRERAGGVIARRLHPLWDVEFFGLAHIARFREMSDADQRFAVDLCCEALLAESWFIERSGVGFCAKMTQLAESFEEARVFALIGAD